MPTPQSSKETSGWGGGVDSWLACEPWQGGRFPGQISGLFQYIRPAAKEAKGDLAKAVEVNVRNQAITLAESSPVLAKLVREKKLVIAGGVYDLTTGKVARVELPQLES